MAGVIAHNRAIDSSANARVLVTFMIVLLPLTARNNDTTSNYNLNSRLTTAAVTVITGLKLAATTKPTYLMKPIERRGEPSLRKNTFTLECIPGFIGTAIFRLRKWILSGAFLASVRPLPRSSYLQDMCPGAPAFHFCGGWGCSRDLGD